MVAFAAAEPQPSDLAANRPASSASVTIDHTVVDMVIDADHPGGSVECCRDRRSNPACVPAYRDRRRSAPAVTSVENRVFDAGDVGQRTARRRFNMGEMPGKAGIVERPARSTPVAARVSC